MRLDFISAIDNLLGFNNDLPAYLQLKLPDWLEALGCRLLGCCNSHQIVPDLSVVKGPE